MNNPLIKYTCLHGVPERRMPVPEHGLIHITRQPRVPLALFSLTVLHLNVQHHGARQHKRQSQHAQVDGVSGDESRRVLRQVGEGCDEGCHVGDHDLRSRARCAHIVRSEVVVAPSHDQRRAREDAGRDEKGARVVDVRAAGADEEDVADHGDGDSDEHERPSDACAVGEIAC